jgi:hypothetical protein
MVIVAIACFIGGYQPEFESRGKFGSVMSGPLQAPLNVDKLN